MSRSSTDDLDAHVQRIVDRTVREQGLDLQVKDPTALLTIGRLVLVAQGGEPRC